VRTCSLEVKTRAIGYRKLAHERVKANRVAATNPGRATERQPGHFRLEPPSTKRVWPVTKSEAREARKIAAPT